MLDGIEYELLVYIGAFIVLTKFDPNYFKLFFFYKMYLF